MDNGHIRQFASPEDIYENPTDLFVAGFMGSPPMNIVTGRVVRGSACMIEIADGAETIRFPAPPQSEDKLARYVDQEIMLGMRPETIGRAEADATAPHLFAFERVIDVVEPTGPDTMLVFTLGGQEAIARVRPEDRAPAGTSYRFMVDMHKAKIFDATTGNRL